MHTSSSDTPSQSLPATPGGRVDETAYPLIDVAGPTVRPLILGEISILRGTIPPGRFVPVHLHTSHTETFIIESGEMQGLIGLDEGEAGWTRYGPGELVHIPANVMHAWRNVSDAPIVALIVAGAPLADFFLDIGRPVDGPLDAQWPPDAAMVEKAMAVGETWDLVSATPEQNAAVGIRLG